jgi:hypothetical protein
LKRRYSTFEERGVHVGFRGRRAAFVRCRRAKSNNRRFEAVIPNWTGELHGLVNDLVLDWESLQHWNLLDGYDLALYEAITLDLTCFDGHIDPIMMEEIRLKVDLEHGDAEQRKRASFELAIARRDAQRSLLDVVAMFGRHIAQREQKPGLTGMTGELLFHLADRSPDELRELVRSVASAISHGTGIPGEVLRDRLDRVADFASPICSLVTADPAGSVGFLSRRFDRVERMHDEMKSFGAR